MGYGATSDPGALVANVRYHAGSLLGEKRARDKRCHFPGPSLIDSVHSTHWLFPIGCYRLPGRERMNSRRISMFCVSQCISMWKRANGLCKMEGWVRGVCSSSCRVFVCVRASVVDDFRLLHFFAFTSLTPSHLHVHLYQYGFSWYGTRMEGRVGFRRALVFVTRFSCAGRSLARGRSSQLGALGRARWARRTHALALATAASEVA